MPDIDLTCPSCGKKNQQADHYDPLRGLVENITPKDGDIQMCITCGRFGIFVVSSELISIRPPTGAETEEILKQPEAVKLAAAVMLVKGKRGA